MNLFLIALFLIVLYAYQIIIVPFVILPLLYLMDPVFAIQLKTFSLIQTFLDVNYANCRIVNFV